MTPSELDNNVLKQKLEKAREALKHVVIYLGPGIPHIANANSEDYLSLAAEAYEALEISRRALEEIK